MFYHCENCNEMVGQAALERTEETDPFGTGDLHHVEVALACPACHSEHVAECTPCECGDNPALDGFDDCAACILSGQYSHLTEYDAGDFHDAREWMRTNDPAGLCAFDEHYGRQHADAMDALAATI